MLMTNRKTILLLILFQFSVGCLSTRAVYHLQQSYENIAAIDETYLLENNRLVIKFDKYISYHDGSSEIEKDKIGLDLEATRKYAYKVTPENFNPQSMYGEKVVQIVKKEKLIVADIHLKDPVVFYPFEYKLTSDHRIPVFPDNAILLSVDKPFIFRKTLVVREGSVINSTQLKINNGEQKQPKWFPIKILFYPMTVAFDIATFPIQVLYCFNNLNRCDQI
jgi:hypothetical protein